MADSINARDAQSLVYADRSGEHSYFAGARRDLMALVPAQAQRILDVGCGAGKLGEALKANGASYVAGIELHEASAALAAGVLDKVVCGSVMEVNLDELGPAHSFDCMIFGDILEHLLDPWATLRRFSTLLAPNGVVVASIPNIGHISVVLGLLAGRWEYGERGLLDRTHLRFFTYRSIVELFRQAGLEIVRVERNVRLVERDRRYARVARLLARGPLQGLFTFQYLVVARAQAAK